jgi:hypothetical protein
MLVGILGGKRSLGRSSGDSEIECEVVDWIQKL